MNLWKQKSSVHYMHFNPGRAGLVERATDWARSSARCFAHGKPVGVPLQWIF